MKKKRFDHLNWHRTTSDQQQVVQLPEGVLVDYVAGEVTRPLHACCCGQELTLLDSGYRWIYFAPNGAHHALTVQLNAQDQPIQFYVDVNEHNGVDLDGIPYGMDLYLDVVALVAGWSVQDTALQDEDELQQALEKGQIDGQQALFAKQEAAHIQDELMKNAFKPVEVVRFYLKNHPWLPASFR